MVFGATRSLDDSRTPLYRAPQVPLEVENYPIAPNGLVLEQLHVYVRHGERTPVGVRLANVPALIPEHWLLCKAARQFHAMACGQKEMVERTDGKAAEGECLLGELTDLGRQSTYNFGKSLRALYVDKLGFLPDRLLSTDQVYLRSTNMPRTITSLHQIVHGLYPQEKRDNKVLPNILVRNGKDENLLGNTSACKRLELLQVSFAHAAAAAYNPSLQQLDSRLSKYMNGSPVRVDGKPRASGIMDTIRAAIAHGINVPPEFKDKAIVDTLEKAIVNEWYAGYKTEEVRRLGMGRLLDDLSRKMQHKANNGAQDPLKVLIHSTHDTALAALCSTLDVFDEQWPAFTASITFELFKKAAVTPQRAADASFSQIVLSNFKSRPVPEFYIRMRYQNKNMILPACAEKGKHLPGSPEFCTLAAFGERVKELTPTDFESECTPAGRFGI
ncbi:putative acid phosphatase SPBC4.06 [Termitomyces sp. J132]|nr:putative acid phosphatase SPBC4.06 [Termitomyces sp. J132]